MKKDKIWEILAVSCSLNIYGFTKFYIFIPPIITPWQEHNKNKVYNFSFYNLLKTCSIIEINPQMNHHQTILTETILLVKKTSHSNIRLPLLTRRSVLYRKEQLLNSKHYLAQIQNAQPSYVCAVSGHQ